MHDGPQNTAPSVTMNAEDAAKYLKMPQTTLKKLCRDGEGPKHARIARVLTFRQSDLDNWLNDQFNKPAVPAKKRKPKVADVAPAAAKNGKGKKSADTLLAV